jgi:hypothetical protein
MFRTISRIVLYSGVSKWERASPNESERSLLIDDVCKKMVKPAMSHEASYALCKAALCVFVHHHSYNKLQEEENLYESKTANTNKSRL